ncbi:Ig-like domain-containing protein [Clostridium botulinum]|uniref:Ig-like domain-containing protein n=1 Tax=Clostridium botulinum TaxID=1491 RepID=UPI0022485CDF|nr:Ig-like domain-containing protein [Clostridium botulinum]UZP02034.1 Ig-like domain-containing protein [Clostridium botulinum]UZP05392.1 Ig-like domain-containing protein [Clostridium botulinum]UZP08773.1 Ig-like domain-containing protein [Clostridium botulinum]
MKNYFKKFSIIFVVVLGIMSIYNINVFADDSFEIGTINLNNTAQNSAKVSDQLIIPEIGWVRYDDTNSNISYLGSGWITYKSDTESGGSTNCITNISDSASVRFNFIGKKIRIINPFNIPHNDLIEVYIDGVKVNEHSVSYPNLRQVVVYENKDLSDGEHSFEYKFLGKGQAVFDAIDLDKDGKLLPYNKSITIDKQSIDLTVGDSQQLTATTTPAQVTWKSSDSLIATVDSNGKVTGIKEGQVTITATTADGLTATCIVNVVAKIDTTEPTDPDESEYIVNTAYAKGDNTNNASGQVSIIFKGVAEAQLKVIKTADVDSVYVGDNFTYTIEVTNTSDKIAKAVIIKDNAPNHIKFIPNEVITTQGTIDSNSTTKNIIVNVGDIQPSGKVIIKIPVLVVE